jgi:hypothetical protein
MMEGAGGNSKEGFVGEGANLGFHFLTFSWVSPQIVPCPKASFF